MYHVTRLIWRDPLSYSSNKFTRTALNLPRAKFSTSNGTQAAFQYLRGVNQRDESVFESSPVCIKAGILDKLLMCSETSHRSPCWYWHVR